MQLSLRDLTGLFDVPEQTVQRWVSNDGLPAQQFNGQLWFNRAVLLEWATLRKMALPARFLQAAGGNGHTPLLSDALAAGGVQAQIAGSTRAEILRSVVQSMPLPDDVERELLLQVLLSRETTGVTDLGDGLAVPHARLPIVLPTTTPLLTVAYLQQPIPSVAGPSRIHTLFVLVCPTTHEHLALLARLAYALRDQEFHSLVQAKAPLQDLLRRARALEEQLTAGTVP